MATVKISDLALMKQVYEYRWKEVEINSQKMNAKNASKTDIFGTVTKKLRSIRAKSVERFTAASRATDWVTVREKSLHDFRKRELSADRLSVISKSSESRGILKNWDRSVNDITNEAAQGKLGRDRFSSSRDGKEKPSGRISVMQKVGRLTREDKGRKCMTTREKPSERVSIRDTDCHSVRSRSRAQGIVADRNDENTVDRKPSGPEERLERLTLGKAFGRFLNNREKAAEKKNAKETTGDHAKDFATGKFTNRKQNFAVENFKQMADRQGASRRHYRDVSEASHLNAVNSRASQKQQVQRPDSVCSYRATSPVDHVAVTTKSVDRPAVRHISARNSTSFEVKIVPPLQRATSRSKSAERWTVRDASGSGRTSMLFHGKHFETARMSSRAKSVDRWTLREMSCKNSILVSQTDGYICARPNQCFENENVDEKLNSLLSKKDRPTTNPQGLAGGAIPTLERLSRREEQAVKKCKKHIRSSSAVSTLDRKVTGKKNR